MDYFVCHVIHQKLVSKMAFAKIMKKLRAEPDLKDHLKLKSQVRTDVYRTSFHR
jgi:hypothetical protein